MYMIPNDVPRIEAHAVISDNLLRENPSAVKAEAHRKLIMRLLGRAVDWNIDVSTGVNETVFSVDFYLVTPAQMRSIISEAMQEGVFAEIRRSRGVKK